VPLTPYLLAAVAVSAAVTWGLRALPFTALAPLRASAAVGYLSARMPLGVMVILSSHLVTDLERVCDHVILLAGSQVQLCGDIDTLLAEHTVLVGPCKDTAPIEQAHKVVQTVVTARQTTLLVRLNGPVVDPAYQAEDVTFEELVLAYMGAEEASAGKHLTTVGEGS
jgi:ABC-2 type transport system ATP-binding protein